jgi:hypothetical protein
MSILHFMGKVKSVQVFDLLTRLVDTINLEPDPAIRLSSFMYLADKYREMVLPERDRAAYDARARYAAADAADISGSDIIDIYRWAGEHRRRTDAPKLGRRPRIDLDNATIYRA